MSCFGSDSGLCIYILINLVFSNARPLVMLMWCLELYVWDVCICENSTLYDECVKHYLYRVSWMSCESHMINVLQCTG